MYKKVCLISLFLLGVCLLMTPKIYLDKKKEIVLNYPNKYIEPGYEAKILGKDITKGVEVKGNVNDDKLGTYQLKYVSQNLVFRTEVVRTVKVIDNEPPKITLNGSENTKICPNTKYVEEGYEVSDNFDKNIKDKVKVIKKNYGIIYEVKDARYNKTKVIRKIIELDDVKPNIDLFGNETEHLFLNEPYKELGYKAKDNCDGDLTDKVKIKGKVNSSKPGEYNIKYEVSDKVGNKKEVQRTVVVNKNKRSASGCGIAGAIYLTFDDGPDGRVTPKILDILKKENVKATFFVTSGGPDELIQREYLEGHTVALHTASHNYYDIYLSKDKYFNDLDKVSKRVEKLTGEKSKIIRFPGGSSNTISRKTSKGIMTKLTEEVVLEGYKYYDWNVNSEDAGSCARTRKPDCVYSNVVNNLSKHKCNMVLMHDIKNYTAEALDKIIKYGKNNGYKFKQIDGSTAMVKQRVNN